MKNREKILVAAVELFNAQGFVNVRLQHISDATIISLGNIAYHFKNKEAIVTAIFLDWEKRQKEVLLTYRNTPIFHNIQGIFEATEALQEAYSFFFTDVVEIKRAYPQLFAQIIRFYHWQVLMFEEVIRFNASRGALQLSDGEEQTHFVATLVVRMIQSWKATQLAWEEPQHLQAPGNESHARGDRLSTFIWQILYPYMTQQGQEEYQVLKEGVVKMHINKSPHHGD